MGKQSIESLNPLLSMHKIAQGRERVVKGTDYEIHHPLPFPPAATSSLEGSRQEGNRWEAGKKPGPPAFPCLPGMSSMFGFPFVSIFEMLTDFTMSPCLTQKLHLTFWRYLIPVVTFWEILLSGVLSFIPLLSLLNTV